MPELSITIARCLAITLSAVLMAAAVSVAGIKGAPTARMELAVSFAVQQSLLLGTARLEIPAGQSAALSLAGLRVTGAVIGDALRENRPLQLSGEDHLALAAAPQPRILLISYEKEIGANSRDIISEQGIALTSGWHPVPDSKVLFSLTAQVPPGFMAISEADYLTETDPGGTANFSFSEPLSSLTFAAAPYVKSARTVREGLTVYTLFFKQNQDLAEAYLEAAAAYIKRYESSIGPFPYNHYVIAENIRPTGYGLPTFTLLGSQVIRLPFIRQTSLGHEILHSWFGNSVDVDYASGNWCEGLTTYLADMAYRAEAGEGARARKEVIQNYLAYVDAATPPLSTFYAAGHTDLTGKASRAVGYGRSAMLFHQLHLRLGTDSFWSAIRRFYQEYRGKTASWHDLEALFEAETGAELDRFFAERLSSTALPDLALENVKVTQQDDSARLFFTLVQRGEQSFEFLLPMLIKTITGEQRATRLITEGQTEVSIELDTLPLELIVDPDYDLMRRLTSGEGYPILAHFFGAGRRLVVLADENERSRYAPLLELADRNSWQVKTAGEVETAELAESSVLFLGTGSELSRTLFGRPPHPSEGFTIEMRFNPLQPEQVVGLVSSSSRAETAAAAHRLEHYGSYSYLHFKGGRNMVKEQAASQNGIRVALMEKPVGIALAGMQDFEELADELARNRVIYVGETHTSRADHLLQLMLLEALHRRVPELVIGMEMFPRASQPALDDYISDHSVTEGKFLEQSRYFDVWGYDYRLFRPIFAYARTHGVPVLGLNLDKEIVSTVFKSGTEAVDADLARTLPPERVLDMPGYRERLEPVFSRHGEHGGGTFPGFLQAQALWDETMAVSITDYLTEHPAAVMLVLAGSQHTRKDSGIPPRVARRMALPQAIVGNSATSPLAGKELLATTDYLFFLEAEDLPTQGKIGIVLDQSGTPASPGLAVREVNPDSLANEAGLQAGDIIVEIAGQPIAGMADVRSAMLERAVGDTVPIRVLRPTENQTMQDLTLEVELYDPAASRTNPVPGMGR